MRELVSLALCLCDIAGSVQGALTVAVRLQSEGRRAFGNLQLSTDVKYVLDEEVLKAGVLDRSGAPQAGRSASLIVLLDAMREMPLPARIKPMPRKKLVYTLPKSAAHMADESSKISILVQRLIISSERILRIGGPFWNDDGLEQLREVLEKAIEFRKVHCDVFLHLHGSSFDTSVLSYFHRLSTKGSVKIYRFNGNDRSMMHAKFCLVDGITGYFGTANFTSLGMSEHLEVGVQLEEEQAQELNDVLESLISSQVFADLSALGDASSTTEVSL